MQIKSLDEAGRFVGLASTYGNVDLGGDVVEPGAFQKTITDRGGEVPLLFAHDSRQPIGLARLKDTGTGLAIEGQLVLQVPKAQETYSLLKAKVLRGLSIGYDAVKAFEGAGGSQTLQLSSWETGAACAARASAARNRDARAEASEV